jgi:hypothetical protein
MSTTPYQFVGFGAMDVTKPYKCIGFGAMDVDQTLSIYKVMAPWTSGNVTKPYKFIGFGAMDVDQTLSICGAWGHGCHQTL